jgi:hypothetical protein
LLSPVSRYISDHWRGRHGLAWSFWINLVGLRAAIILAQIATAPAGDEVYHFPGPWIWFLMALFHGLVFLWQIVGVLRSAENHLRDTGSQASVWGAQIALVAVFWITASYALEAWQLTLPKPEDQDHLARMDREHASKYSLTLSDDRKILFLKGSIELGITRNMEAIAKQGGLQLVVLDSAGGNVFEARGLARVFRENNLNTHVETTCSSACTLAFIGGRKRTLSSTGRIGFHQYRFDANISIIAANPVEEQERDRKLFSDSGVSEAFLEKMFQSRSSDMWFPDAKDMLDASVVNGISDTVLLPSGDTQ